MQNCLEKVKNTTKQRINAANITDQTHNVTDKFHCNTTLCYRKFQSYIFVPKTKLQGSIYISIGALLEVFPFYSASEVYFDFNTPRMVYLLVFVLAVLFIFILPGIRPFYPTKKLLCLKSLDDILAERERLQAEIDAHTYGRDSFSAHNHRHNQLREQYSIESGTGQDTNQATNSKKNSTKTKQPAINSITGNTNLSDKDWTIPTESQPNKP